MPTVRTESRTESGKESRRRGVLAAGTAALVAAAAVVTAAPAWGAAGGTTLTAGQNLTAGQSITINNGEYRLTMQSDGNLVEYTFANTPLWSSRTAGNSGAQADMQADGNLVVYNSAHKALWASGTNGNQNSYLAIQGDGNVVIYNTAHNAVWATNTPIIAGGTNDYPYATSTIDADDGWGFLARECTSFVAWRIRHNLKISDFTNGWRGGWFGNAGDWAANARNLGLVVNSTPAVDSVAVLPAGVDGAGSVGHVAFVLGVGNGTITVEDYNYADSYDGMQYYVYSQHTINTAGVSFIHFR